MKLTVYHDGQFWVGIFEEVFSGHLRACKYLFGNDPQDDEILKLINSEMLILFNNTSQYVNVNEPIVRKKNPKRLAREAAYEMKKNGVSTKARQALQLELEKNKTERRTLSRQQKEEEAERKWLLRRQKIKEKHRGR